MDALDRIRIYSDTATDSRRVALLPSSHEPKALHWWRRAAESSQLGRAPSEVTTRDVKVPFNFLSNYIECIVTVITVCMYCRHPRERGKNKNWPPQISS